MRLEQHAPPLAISPAARHGRDRMWGLVRCLWTLSSWASCLRLALLALTGDDNPMYECMQAEPGVFDFIKCATNSELPVVTPFGQLVLIAAQVARQGSSAPRARHSRAACRGQTDLWNCNQSNICPPRACWPRSISYRTAGAPVAQPRTPLRRAVAAREGSAADTTAARATRTPCVGILGVCPIPLLFPEICHSTPARHRVVPLSRN